MRRIGGGLGLRLVLLMLLPAWLCLAAPPQAISQGNDIVRLMQRINEHFKVGEFDQALPLARKLVVDMEQAAGKEHALTATALMVLGETLNARNDLSEAETVFTRALAIREKTLGPDHADVAQLLSSLANIAISRAQYPEAERYLQRALAIRERALGAEHHDTAMTLASLARIRLAQARYDEAEALTARALTPLLRARGPERMLAATVLNNLAVIYKEQGRYALAEARLREAMTVREEQLGSSSLVLAPMLNNLAELYNRQGRYTEAEELERRALQLSEKSYGPDHPDVGIHLGNLALILSYEGRASEAESLHRRALAIAEKSLGPRHPNVASFLNNLAHAIDAQGRPQEAEALYRRALALREAVLGPDHDSVAASLSNLGASLAGQQRFEEAEPVMRRALAINEKVLGPGHPQVAEALNGLGFVLDSLKRPAEAEPLMRRSLAIREAALGSIHPDVAIALNNLGGLQLDRRDWPAAHASYKRAYDIWVARRSALSGTPEEGRQVETVSKIINPYIGLTIAAYRMAEATPGDAALRLRAEAFEAAQWAGAVSAGAAIQRLAARAATGGGALGDLVRQRQDLAEQASATDRARIALMSQPEPQRAPGASAALGQRAETIARTLKDLDAAIATRFPQYAALVGAGPVTLSEAATLLHPDEALLLLTSGRDNAYLWAVTRDASRWVEIPLGSKALEDDVAALRCGLDATGAWSGEGAQRCAELLGLASPSAAGMPAPFDVARAHALYRALLGPVEHLIAGKQLLVVATEPLASLPFHVLVTDMPASTDTVPAAPAGSPSSPDADDRSESAGRGLARTGPGAIDAGAYARVSWLAKRHAVSMLPSVASLRALRQFVQQSQATTPFLGFGNPLLTGPSGTDRAAWERQSCRPAPAPVQVAFGSRAALAPKLLRGGLAQVEDVRRQPPLPETADELCAVARLLGAPEASVNLGANATERRIKLLSENGTLRRARILHFATHGLVAAETERVSQSGAEPALLLTPPAQASEEEDGLLMASEVAQLKLDADWVILSACNTAAGDKLDAEALSGLARAFFYAGSRALLASHWSVDSDATVALITRAFVEMNAGAGRAEALRRAMLALIARGGLSAHPSTWGPFVVVGEGRR